MFDDALLETPEGLESLVSALARIGSSDGAMGSDGQRVDQLALLERVKAAVAAAQVRVTAAFVDSQEQVAQAWRERARACSDAGDFEGWRATREQARAASLSDGDGKHREAAGAGAKRRRRPSGMTGVAAQVALARRESPVQGAGHVRLALALARDMPHALAALEAGELSEWRAQILVRETATLTREDRRLVDAEIVGNPAQPVGVSGDRELVRRVRAVAYRVDAASVLARAAKARADRRVTLRPAPDTMAYVTALLPVAQAVATHAALTVAADAARAAGDERGKGQVMADTLVERVTGQVAAEAVPVEVQLVMTDRALLAGDSTPAQIPGYGTLPAQWARDLLTPREASWTCAPGSSGDSCGAGPGPRASTATDVASASGVGAVDRAVDGRSSVGSSAGSSIAPTVWLRRLYTHPATGALVAMDSTRRTFDGGLRRYLLARDAGTCRTLWCDAPARHLDHVHDYADGGPTSAGNGQGLCVRCNLTKQLPGFSATTLGDEDQRGAPHTVVTTTPTGHTYTSQAPPLLPDLLTLDDPAPPLEDPAQPAEDAAPPVHVGDPPEPIELDTLSPFERVLALALAA